MLDAATKRRIERPRWKCRSLEGHAFGPTGRARMRSALSRGAVAAFSADESGGTEHVHNLGSNYGEFAVNIDRRSPRAQNCPGAVREGNDDG